MANIYIYLVIKKYKPTGQDGGVDKHTLFASSCNHKITRPQNK